MARIKRRRKLSEPMAPHPSVTRRVVCSAIRFGDILLLGCRHYDVTMRNQIRNFSRVTIKKMNAVKEEQGFLDQWGNFLTRELAYDIALSAGQIPKEGTETPGHLFSEDVW